MAFNERALDSYIDVATRIADFREKYPEGSLQPANPESPWEIATVNGMDKNGEQQAQTFIVYVAAAYRTPDDPRPGIGAAWEIWPGRTNYTRGSELQNAETSAWGRAIIAVGASDSKAGIASREEVAARRAERDDGLPVNRDGSLSRSRTSDAEKDAAGVMTAAQLAEHTALGGGHPGERKTGKDERPRVVRAVMQAENDPWLDQPAGHLDGQEREPGTITPQQQRAMHAACTGMDRDKRLATISDIVGRQVTSSNELSYAEAATVLGKLAGAQP